MVEQAGDHAEDDGARCRGESHPVQAARSVSNVLERFETTAEKLVFRGLVAGMALGIGVAVASVASQVGAPSPGFVVWPNLVVPAIGEIASAPEVGLVPERTVVASADGASVRDAAALRTRVREAPVGTRIAYEFRRGTRETRLSVPTTWLRWRDVAPVMLPYLVEGVVLLLTALVIFLFRPGDPAARAGVALAIVSGFMQLLAVDLFSAGWLQRTYFVVESLVPAALLHFALSFPEPVRLLRRHPGVVWGLYAACLPLAVLQNVFLTSDPQRHLAVNDWVYTSAAAAGLFSMVALARRLVTTRTALARQQVKVVLAGIAAAVVVPALGLVAIIILGVHMHMNSLTPFFVLYPMSIAYAVARHDLFHVDRYLRLGVGWAAVSVIVFGSYAAIALAGQAWLGPQTRAPHLLVPFYVLVMLLVMNPLRARIQRVVDSLFHRQGYDHRETVDAMSRALASVLDADRIAATVLGMLTRVMAAEWAGLVVWADGHEPLRVYAEPPGRRDDVERALGPGAALRALDGRWSRYRARAGDPVAALLVPLGAALAFPVRVEARGIGVLLAGDKLSAAFYGDEDVELLDTLANQTALALVNAHASDVIRRTQAELAEADRLAAVGELAAAVAHGIRNPLAGIRTSAEVARSELDADLDGVRESLDDIVSEADRLETRVRTILDFTRPMALALRPGNLAAFARDFAARLGARVPAGVAVELEVASDPPPVAFDAAALGEVVETIAVNALEAGAATLRVQVGREQNGAKRAAYVSISDDGPGMDGARARRVFDLFYTTQHSGTGVGLAMAKRLVERQGGTISVESAPGRGATFRVSLPATDLSADTS
jgi:signal transduction histidine kinase